MHKELNYQDKVYKSLLKNKNIIISFYLHSTNNKGRYIQFPLKFENTSCGNTYFVQHKLFKMYIFSLLFSILIYKYNLT